MPYQSNKPLIILIFIPYALAWMVRSFPVFSYLMAWSGSFLIFYLTLVSPLRILPSDLSLRQQVMRPIVLIQLIFAGFMCCTSIFYFINHIQNNGLPDHTLPFDDRTDLIARCQRLCLLGHASLCGGIILGMINQPRSSFHIVAPVHRLLYKLCSVPLVVAIILNHIPQIVQFRQPMLMLSLCGAVSLLLNGLLHRKPLRIIIGGGIYLFSAFQALFSGYKEGILIHILLLALIAYPYYKRIVISLALPGILVFCLALPTFTTAIRKYSWTKQKNSFEAGQSGLDQLTDKQQATRVEEDHQGFLINRVSEIGMFTQYISAVPEHSPYYGTSILENAVQAIIPRAIWREKPESEALAMERVYQTGIVNRASTASAKTRPIVDAYLSGGTKIIVLFFFVYGFLVQKLCNFCEYRFGGYTIGCSIIFNGIFQCLWRGNTLEFLLNNIVYGCLLMQIIFWLFKHFKLIRHK